MFKYTCFLVVAILLFQNVLSVKKQPWQNIPQTFELPSIDYMSFDDVNRMVFFISKESNIFGYLSRTTGKVYMLYSLENDQYFISILEGEKIVIGKEDQIDIFQMIQNRQYTEFFPKSLSATNFSSIEHYLATKKGYYILFDRVLNYYPKPQLHVRQILVPQTIVDIPDESDEKLIQILQLSEQKLVLISQMKEDTQNYICFRNLAGQINPICSKTDLLNIEDVVFSGDHIFVEYQNQTVIYDKSFKMLHKLDQIPEQYHQGLVSLSKKGQSFNVADKQFKEIRLIKDYENIGDMFAKITQSNIQIYKNQTLIATLPHSADKILKIWSHENGLEFNLIIEYESSLKSYKLKQKGVYQLIWSQPPVDKNEPTKEQNGADIQMNIEPPKANIDLIPNQSSNKESKEDKLEKELQKAKPQQSANNDIDIVKSQPIVTPIHDETSEKSKTDSNENNLIQKANENAKQIEQMDIQNQPKSTVVKKETEP